MGKTKKQQLLFFVQRISRINKNDYLCGNEDHKKDFTLFSSFLESLSGKASELNWEILVEIGMVKFLLEFNWQFLYKEKSLLDSYCDCVVQLVSFYPRFVPDLFFKLCEWFVTKNVIVDDIEDKKIEINIDSMHDKIHKLLRKICFLAPLASNQILSAFKKISHYKPKDEKITSYFIKNILSVIHYVPELSDQILAVVTQKIVQLDLDCLHHEHHQIDLSLYTDYIRSSLNSFDPEISHFVRTHILKPFSLIIDPLTKPQNNRQNNPFNNENNPFKTIDKIMEILFDFYDIFKNDKNQLDRLFISTLKSHENYVLSHHTKNIKNAQFCVFYLTNLSVDYSEKYIHLLLDRIIDKNQKLQLRKNCVVHLASFLVRSKYIKQSIIAKVFNILQEFALYILDSLENSIKANSFNSFEDQFLF